mmetsp:Transcript_10786/g.16261  ORF Transcript_10786/g.16261 Transcript_10786/m.16261 type:complete len:222 (-) Transcript_10786:1706-2371(-)
MTTTAAQVDSIVRALINIGNVRVEKTDDNQEEENDQLELSEAPSSSPTSIWPYSTKSTSDTIFTYANTSHQLYKANEDAIFERGPYRCRRCGQIKRHHNCHLAFHQRSALTQTSIVSVSQGTKIITITPSVHSSSPRIHDDKKCDDDQKEERTVEEEDTTSLKFITPRPYQPYVDIGNNLQAPKPEDDPINQRGPEPLPEPLPDEDYDDIIPSKRPRLSFL